MSDFKGFNANQMPDPSDGRKFTNKDDLVEYMKTMPLDKQKWEVSCFSCIKDFHLEDIEIVWLETAAETCPETAPETGEELYMGVPCCKDCLPDDFEESRTGGYMPTYTVPGWSMAKYTMLSANPLAISLQQQRAGHAGMRVAGGPDDDPLEIMLQSIREAGGNPEDAGMRCAYCNQNEPALSGNLGFVQLHLPKDKFWWVPSSVMDSQRMMMVPVHKHHLPDDHDYKTGAYIPDEESVRRYLGEALGGEEFRQEGHRQEEG